MAKAKTAAATIGAVVVAENHITAFFARFPQFNYEPANTASSEYDRMVKHFGWNVGGNKWNRTFCLFHKTLLAQFTCLFGTDDNKLENLQHVCEKLDISPIPASITACKKAIRKVHVNIIDHIECELTGKPVKKFKSPQRLAQYTRDEGKTFPKSFAKSNPLLRFLMRPIFD